MTTEQVLQNTYLRSVCHIKFSGSDASENFMNDVLSIEVEQTLYQPSMAVIRVATPDLDWFDSDIFKVGTATVISMGQSQDALGEVFNGEVTSLEFKSVNMGYNVVTIRCYDKMHRLQRGRKTKTFLNMSDSDIITKVANDAGLTPNVTSTTVVHDYLIQNNETNLELVMRRANRMGMEVLVEGSKLTVREKTTTDSVEVKYGETIIEFAVRMSTGYQVNKVEVRGWDWKQKTAITGQSTSGASFTAIGLGKTGASSGQEAYSSAADTTFVSIPVDNQTEAEKIAKAVHDEMEGQFVQAEGKVLGDKNIAPGKNIKVSGVGTKYSGKYYVTSVTHYYDSDGYYTTFVAGGRQVSTLFNLTNQGNQFDLAKGLVPGVVTNLKDPENKGRVKVKFPILPQDNGNDIESNWARIAAPMSGNSRGFYFMPEVNDEVLVGFENGDVNRPYVIGFLWNGTDAPPDTAAVDSNSGKVKKRMLKTVKGHSVTFDETDESPMLEIKTSTGHTLTFNEKSGEAKVELKTAAGHKITLDDSSAAKIEVVDKTGSNKITIDSNSNTINVEAASGGNLNLKATGGKLTLDAAQIEIKGAASTKIQAPTVQVSGDGMVEVKGGIIKLN